jgi:hypothetical protein
LRRLRKLGVNNDDKSDESATNQKRALETSSNINNNLADASSIAESKKDDNKNTITTGKLKV